MKICDRSHICVKAATCPHAIPHDSQCAIAMPCYDDPSGEISACVEIKDGKYSTWERKWCKCCGGKGFEDVEHIHFANTNRR